MAGDEIFVGRQRGGKLGLKQVRSRRADAVKNRAITAAKKQGYSEKEHNEDEECLLN